MLGCPVGDGSLGRAGFLHRTNHIKSQRAMLPGQVVGKADPGLAAVLPARRA